MEEDLGQGATVEMLSKYAPFSPARPTNQEPVWTGRPSITTPLAHEAIVLPDRQLLPNNHPPTDSYRI